MGLFTLQMQATGATITQLFGNPNLNSTFTITGGSLPLEFGETISGTHTGVDNNIDDYFGLNQGSVFMFMLNKSAIVRYSINGTLYVNQTFGSGTIELVGPIVNSADTISIDVRPITAFDIPTPTLWYDAADATTLGLTNSGGTNFVDSWTSKGTYTNVLTGTTTQRPIYSGSTTLPGNPNIVRFTTDGTASNRDYLADLTGTTFITNNGFTVFQVLTKPSTGASMTASFKMYSGGTNGTYTGANSKFQLISQLTQNTITTQTVNSGGTTNSMASTNISGYSKNSNYLTTYVVPATNGEFMEQYVNSFYSASTTPYVLNTGLTANKVMLNVAGVSSAGAVTAAASSNELAEVIYYNRELTQNEIYIVQNYLENKWLYDTW
jgi:hypothetical protein